MKLIITRHGETEENKAGILQGQIPGTLSELGIEQAKKLALRLKDEEIDYIYSSDLARAADTAQEIVKYHPEVPFELTKELRERDLGKFAGKQKSGCGFDDPSIESIVDIRNRASQFIKKVIAQHPNDTVLLVGHAGMNRNIIAVLEEKEFDDTPVLLNTSITIFQVDKDGKVEIELDNDASHLE
ncbi:MAG: histidine phosphatase family protein [Patescibacteria group bacterium]|nr:histidine phosphatase family protein [Patescibacteria group bacterium]